MKKVVCMMALAAITFGSVYATPAHVATGVPTLQDTTKKKMKMKGDKKKMKMKADSGMTKKKMKMKKDTMKTKM